MQYPSLLAGLVAPRVLGRVSLWGDVVECAWGWRASFAYPAQIYVPDRVSRGGMSRNA